MIHKTTRSILSVLLAVLLLVTSVPLTPAFADGGGVSLPSASGEGSFAGGTGTANDPYQIATAEELWDFAELVNGGKTDASAILTDDIDLNPDMKIDEDGKVTNGNELDQWTPIGTSIDNPYEGTFNGDGHTISGLYIDRSDNDQGLFRYVGSSGKIEKLSVSGDISGHLYVGGIAGQNNGNVINCTFSGTVSGISYVGGVVGYNGASVKNCYNTGAVSGSGLYVGGVVGLNGGSVENCYNTGTVNGSAASSNVGGVVGWNDSGTVTNCYNTGAVNSSGNYVGGVVGWNSGSGIVTDCYFLQDTAEKGIGNDDSGDADPLTVEAFKKQENFTDWDFGSTNTWTIHPVLGRPVLNKNWEGGDGSPDSPYEISTATELKNFAIAVNDGGDTDAHAKLMNNIDLNGNATNQWTPIGTSSSNSYRGTFDGNGHKIENLYINTTDSGAENQGLFGFVGSEGTVQNLTVSGSVKGHSYVGGVVGYNNGGTVTGCIFSGSGSVSGSYYVGGVVGDNEGTVENCTNTGSVNGSANSSNVGGVVGQNNVSSTVENCYNTGKVTGSSDYSYIGGVVGFNSGSVKNCYNTGEVSGPNSGTSNYVGGVVGYNSGTVTNCYFLQTETVNTKLQGSGDATGKDNTAFHSGEVAWLLENGQAEDQTTPVWGQSDLTTDKSWPTLVALDKNENAKPVYKVAFISDNTEIESQYANSGMTVGSPTTNPTKEGYTFAGWFTESSGGSQWNFSTAVTENMTLYAQWTAVEDPDPEPTPDPEPEDPPYSGKYSYEISTDIGAGGALSVDRYATEGDPVTIQVTPDLAYKLDDLSVTANGKDVALTDNGDGTYTFTMPSADVRITATFAEDPDWTEPEPEPSTDVSDLFIDIARDAWYKDAIQYAYDNGLMTGVSDTEFAPEATTTRAMIVSILARLEGVESAQAAGFADVNDEWYATAVNWAASVGVVNGYEDNTFRPNTAITREQLAAILMNYAACIGQDVSNRASLTSYTDQPSTWAEEAMQWAVAEGLITGVTNTELQPQGNATRAQVAAILQRFLEA